MEMEERIKKDIELFEKNIKRVRNERIRDMATRYYEDAKYYLMQKDYFTSFGCINYAHGLIDAILNRRTKMIEINGTIAAGKTCIIETLIEKLKYDYEIGVIISKFVGDEDKKRIEMHGIKAININTGNKCMDDVMLEETLEEFDNEPNLIFFENIDLTCPYIMENSKKLVVLDAVLGKNVIYKFPMAIQLADFVIINKIDLANATEIENEIKKITNASIIQTNCKSGEGMETLLEWIKKLL